MAQYTLNFINNSTLSGNFCIYQTDPSQEINKNIFSLVWFSKYCHPNTKCKFQWSIEYSFVWAETGVLIPGVIFEASENLSASLTDTSKNSIGFTNQNGAYRFIDTKKSTSEGSLGIYTDNTIPTSGVSIGIGMAGKPVFVKEASPNYNFTFQPHPQYWVAFGDFEEGTVLDVNSVTNSRNVVYPVNIYSQTAILEKNNTWTIQSRQQRNNIFRMSYTMSNEKIYKCGDCNYTWGSPVQPNQCPHCGSTKIYEKL